MRQRASAVVDAGGAELDAQGPPRALAPVDVLWFHAVDPDSGRWAIEGVHVDGRHAGVVTSLRAPPTRSPDGRVLAVVEAGPDTVVRLLDGADGSVVGECTAPAPLARSNAADVDLQACWSSDGLRVVTLHTEAAHAVDRVVEKPDPDGSLADDVAVGPWTVRRALQVIPIGHGHSASVDVPCPSGTLAAARLEVRDDVAIVHSVIARPATAQGTKTVDAGFDAVRSVWMLWPDPLAFIGTETSSNRVLEIPGNDPEPRPGVVDLAHNRLYVAGDVEARGIGVLRLPDMELVARWQPMARFEELAAGAGGCLFARVADSRTVVVFGPDGAVRTVAELRLSPTGVVS